MLKRLFAVLWKLLLALLLLVLLAGALVTWQGYRMYSAALEELPPTELAAQVQAAEGYTAPEEIAPLYLLAVVETEDRRFYSHAGVDVISISRALLTNLQSGTLQEGGSTITQQLAKNMYFTQEQSLVRKVADVFMALQLEQQLDKETILALYVNTIYFGSGYYGITEAAEGYYGKAPADLSDYESTMLAGIPNAPSVYDLNVNPDLAAERQLQVLACLQEGGRLSEEDTVRILQEGAAAEDAAEEPAQDTP